MKKAYYLVAEKGSNVKSVMSEESDAGITLIEPSVSGLWNLATDRSGNGLVQATIAVPEMRFSFDDLKEKSVSLGHTLYYLPSGCALIFNEDGYLLKAYEVGEERIWQFIRGWPMPYECFLNGFPFGFDLKRMWSFECSVEKVDVKELAWILDVTWWESKEKGMYSLRPREVLDDVEGFPGHGGSIEKANLDLPLMLGLTQQNRWLILDGVHRYVKAVMEGQSSIDAKKFDRQQLKKFIEKEDEERFERWTNGLL